MPHTLSWALGACLLAGSLLFGGCRMATPSVAPQAIAAGRATLVVSPEIRPAGRRLQALVAPLTAADVDHVRVQLTRVTPQGDEAVLGDGLQLVQRLTRSQLQRPLVLSQLHPHTRYRVRAWAYQAPDELPETLISQEAVVDVEVGADDRPTVATLRIPLVDVVFNGKATLPGIELVPGRLVPDGVESVELPFSEWLQVPIPVTWLGLAGDRVSKRQIAPDGQPDAGFRLAVDLPEPVTLRAVSVDGVDAEGWLIPGQHWTTWDWLVSSDRMLEVLLDGQPLNTGFVSRLGRYSGPVTFELHAHTDGDFTPGAAFAISLYLSNGTVIWDMFTVPEQEEG